MLMLDWFALVSVLFVGPFGSYLSGYHLLIISSQLAFCAVAIELVSYSRTVIMYSSSICYHLMLDYSWKVDI